MFSIYTPLTQEEVYTQRSTQKAPLGSRGITTDGRRWVYCYAGGDISIGSLIYSVTPGNVENSSRAWSTDAITSTTLELNVNHTSSCTDALAIDELRDGYVYWSAWHTSSATTGGGRMVQIEGNTAFSGGTVTDGFTLYLRNSPGAVNPTTSSDTGKAHILRNPYRGVAEFPGAFTMTSGICGVAPIEVTSGYYFWACTWGLCPVKTDGSGVIGCNAYASTTTSTDNSASYVWSLKTTASDSSSVRNVAQLPKVGLTYGSPSTTAGEHDLVFLMIQA